MIQGVNINNFTKIFDLNLKFCLKKVKKKINHVKNSILERLLLKFIRLKQNLLRLQHLRASSCGCILLLLYLMLFVHHIRE